MLFVVASAHAEVAVPPLKARVTDLTATLTATQRDTLERKLAEFERRKGAQLAVLLVPSTAPEAIEQYSIRVVEAWQLGRKGVADGMLLLVAKNDRKMRIEVGRGLEGVIPDAVANRVREEIVVPYFRQGDFYGGLDAALSRLIRLIDGEPLPAPQARDPEWTRAIDLLPFLFIGTFVVGGILRSIFGRLVGASIAGGVVGISAWIITGLLFAVPAALIAFVLVLAAGATTGRGGRGGWSSGGGGGGWSGASGSDSGGFSGGGGDFGGGGSSGSW